MPENLRITPDEVLEAFEKTGLKPARTGYFPSEGCACGLGAKARHLGIITDAGIVETNKGLVAIYGHSYHDGFAWGFDGHTDDSDGESDRFIQGYEDGQAAWEAVKHLAVKNETT